MPFVFFIIVYVAIDWKLAPQSEGTFFQKSIALLGGMAAFALSAAIL